MIELAERYVFRVLLIDVVGLLAAIYNTPRSFYMFGFINKGKLFSPLTYYILSYLYLTVINLSF